VTGAISYPQEVAVTLERYLSLIDSALPGRLEGLYLVGSVALRDYHPGQSDVDFVAMTRDRLRPEELEQLRQLHAHMRSHGKPWFDGIYVTWLDLDRDPTWIEDVPFALERRFEPTGGAEANPSVWLTLRNHPVAARGPAAPSVWYDESAIRDWNIANLNSYWRRQAERLETATEIVDGLAMDWATLWCVAGVSRLHYTAANIDVISKAAACSYALERFPQRWHTVIREAAAVRAGDPARDRDIEDQRIDVRDFIRFVIEDANALAQHPRGAASR
jgi:hypothetical protein